MSTCHYLSFLDECIGDYASTSTRQKEYEERPLLVEDFVSFPQSALVNSADMKAPTTWYVTAAFLAVEVVLILIAIVANKPGHLFEPYWIGIGILYLAVVALMRVKKDGNR